MLSQENIRMYMQCGITVIKNDDNVLHNCNNLSTGTQKAKKSTTEKGTQYKDIPVEKVYSTTDPITPSIISIQYVPHVCTFSESEKNNHVCKSGTTGME